MTGVITKKYYPYPPFKKGGIYQSPPLVRAILDSWDDKLSSISKDF
jgi:hypothetical protein